MSTTPHFTIRNPQSALLLLCLLAFALRLGPAFDNRFHPDEALFSSWSLKIAHGENMLLGGLPIDKPPLLIYVTAISFLFFGQTEIAGRLPNLIASVLSVLLVVRLERGTGDGGRGMVIAALLYALSPFAILFAPTAFLDPMMIMFGLASLVAASRDRAGWAGILLGLSFATKVQGLFFAPVLIVFYQSRSRQDTKNCQKTSWLRDFVVSLVSFASIALIVLLWDRLRGGAPFWLQQSINYGGIRLINPGEVGPRLIGWLSFLPYFFGPIAGAISVIVIPIGVWLDLTRFARTREAQIDLLLLAFLISYISFHWLLAFQVWDRYLLLIVPIAALLIGRLSMRIIDSFKNHVAILPLGHVVSPSRHLAISLSLLLSITVLPFSSAASKSQYPIGGDHGANDGIDQVASYLAALPAGTVVYDHWLAWELSYYLGEGQVYIAYFDTPGGLAGDLQVFAAGGEDRYVVFPAGESPAKSIDAIKAVGFQMMRVYSAIDRFNQISFTIFKITPAAH